MHAGRIIGECRRVDRRRLRGVAFPRHDAAHRLRQHVLPALVRIGSFGAKAGADGEDDARVERRQCLVAEPHPLHDTSAEIVDDDVGAFDQPADDSTSRFRAEVQRDATLVAVEAAEYRVERTGRVVDRRARQIPGADALDLDHVSAQSPSIWVQQGPSMTWVKSTTLTPSSGSPGMATVLPERG